MFNYYILLLKKTTHTLIIMATERTFIMIKPDGVHRRIVGEIIKRFENKGFKLVAMKFMQASVEHLEKHCADLSKKPFFAGFVEYMASGPVVAMVWEGLNAVKTGRAMLGETNPADSKPGHDFWHRSVAVVSAYRGIGSSLNLWGSAQRTGQRGGLASTCENIR